MMSLSSVSKHKKGAWSKEEDELLRTYIKNFGVGKWCDVPKGAGLNRCRKSCRLRWLNHLKPNIKHGNFGEDETELIIRLHGLLGNRWLLIAGRLPGRTGNDVKNYWDSYLSKNIKRNDDHAQRVKPIARVAPQQETALVPQVIPQQETQKREGACRAIKPTPWVVPKGWVWSRDVLPAAASSIEEPSPLDCKETKDAHINMLGMKMIDAVVGEFTGG